MLLLLIISLHFCSRHCFWTHIFIFMINQRFWYSFTMLLLFALLFVRLIIKIACTIGIDSILQSFMHLSNTWANDWINEWKNIWTYDILAAEYQFVGCENSIWIATYCKDMASFIHPYSSWLILWFTQLVSLSIRHTCKNNKKHIQIFKGKMNVFVTGS